MIEDFHHLQGLIQDIICEYLEGQPGRSSKKWPVVSHAATETRRLLQEEGYDVKIGETTRMALAAMHSLFNSKKLHYTNKSYTHIGLNILPGS